MIRLPLATMSLVPSTPEYFIEGFLFESGFSDLEGWTSVLRLLDFARERFPERYQRYLEFMREYLPLDQNSITGLRQTGLTTAQKGLLLFVLDVFTDNVIITYDTFEEWQDVWETTLAPFARNGYEAFVTRPELVDEARLERAWQKLRAAIS